MVGFEPSIALALHCAVVKGAMMAGVQETVTPLLVVGVVGAVVLLEEQPVMRPRHTDAKTRADPCGRRVLKGGISMRDERGVTPATGPGIVR
jgi:hypothetical protein